MGKPKLLRNAYLVWIQHRKTGLGGAWVVKNKTLAKKKLARVKKMKKYKDYKKHMRKYEPL